MAVNQVSNELGKLDINKEIKKEDEAPCPLNRLPLEIHHKILRNLPRWNFVSLGQTCKKMSAVSLNYMNELNEKEVRVERVLIEGKVDRESVDRTGSFEVTFNYNLPSMKTFYILPHHLHNPDDWFNVPSVRLSQNPEDISFYYHAYGVSAQKVIVYAEEVYKTIEFLLNQHVVQYKIQLFKMKDIDFTSDLLTSIQQWRDNTKVRTKGLIIENTKIPSEVRAEFYNLIDSLCIDNIRLHKNSTTNSQELFTTNFFSLPKIRACAHLDIGRHTDKDSSGLADGQLIESKSERFVINPASRTTLAGMNEYLKSIQAGNRDVKKVHLHYSDKMIDENKKTKFSEVRKILLRGMVFRRDAKAVYSFKNNKNKTYYLSIHRGLIKVQTYRFR